MRRSVRHTRRAIAYLAIALGMALPAGVLAQSASDRFAAAGYTVVAERTESGLPTYDLEDGAGNAFSVSVIGAVRDAQLEAIDRIVEVAFQIDGLTIDRMRIVFQGTRADAVIIPARFTVDGRNRANLMPSGVAFSFDQALAYDFRLLVDNLTPRINGQFLTMEQFIDRIRRAIANPAAFIQSQDPVFLARRMDEQQRQIDGVIATDLSQDAALAATSEELTSRIDTAIAESVTRDEELLARGVAAERQLRRDGEAAIAAMTATTDERTAAVDERFAALEAYVADLEARHVALREEHDELLVQFERVREGAVIMASQGLFGGPKAVSAEAIAAVVAARASNSALTIDEAREQVNAQLPEGAEALSKKHVTAIFAYYFNAYEN